MKNPLIVYINQHGGTPRLAWHSLVRNAIASDFVRKVAETFATRILLIGIALITGVIVARILGPEGRGLYAIAVTLATTGVQFGNLGLHASNTYFVAKDRTLLPALVGNTLFVSFVIGGLIACLALLLFFLWPNLAPVHGPLLAFALMWIPLGLAYMLMQNILLGIHEVRAYNKIELVMQIVGVTLIGVVIISHFVTVEIVFFMGLVTVAVSAAWAFWRIKPHLLLRPSFSFPLFINNIQYGIKAYLAAFFAFLVLRADMLMVKYMLGAEQAGYYSIAVSMADMTYILPVTAGAILFPKLSAIHNIDEKWDLTKKTAIGIAFVMTASTAIASLLVAPIIQLLFGKPFLPAAPAFIWLMPGIVMLSIASVFSSFIASVNIPAMVVILYFCMALLNVILNLYFIPLLGIIGASISSTISYTLCFTGIFIISKKVGGK